MAYILLFSILCSVAYTSNTNGQVTFNAFNFVEKVLMDNRIGRIFYF